MKNMNDFIELSTKTEVVDVLRGGLKVIRMDDYRYIPEGALMETVGDEQYTLSLIYVIENILRSYVENEDLDEVLMDYTDQIIMSLINTGDFVYVIKDGVVYHYDMIIDVTEMEAVYVEIPYLLELEQAADELLGFWKVMNNLELREEDKNEMMSQVLSDDLYSFIYLYCREIWWDGGSY